MAKTEVLDETDLIALCKKGDMQSYEVLYRRYSHAMFHTCLRIVTDHTDAEDILQEAFMDAFKNLEKLKDTNAFAGWVKRIVMNKSIDFLRRKPKIQIVKEDPAWNEIPCEEVIDEVIFEGDVELIKQALNQLPDKYRLIMNLHLFEKMNFEQIAASLNVPSGTIRSQYLRGRKKILEQVKKT